MVRPIYAHEMCDPDFSWLITTFRENNPEYVPVESSCLPIVLVNFSPSGEKGEGEFQKEEYPTVTNPEEHSSTKEGQKTP